jgi:serine/threonine-protein kinase
MPRVTGQSYDRAATALHAIGLNATERTVHDARHDAGYVLTQSVPLGTRIGTGSSVVLTVATGPRTESVNPADYVGHPAAEVTTALRAKNLVVTTTTTTTTTKDMPAGSVVSVTPSGSLHEGETVTVTVAAPPPPPPHHHKGKHD